MPKMKTNSSAKKRFQVTGSGKVKRKKAFKSHILTKKSHTRKKELGKDTIVHSANFAHVQKLLVTL
ncbi:50S ribosomal protein L35 [Bacteroidota bacterium]|nr:50S ribosomal protein L35 [Bacteroidota bacterium]